MSQNIFSTVAKHAATCRRFQGASDCVLYLYGRLLRRIRRGLPARRAVVCVRLRGQKHPFYLRLSSTDWLVLEEIFHQGEYAVVERGVKNARCVVDLGANAGLSVRYWHALYPAARIVAVEPHPGNCQTFERNMAAADLMTKVTLVRAAVGSRVDRAELSDCGGEWAYQVHRGGHGAGVMVDICPLDQILDRHAPGRTVDLLKCDIEGAEQELFAECGSWINRIAAMVIELHPPYGLAELQKDLARAGAKFCVVESSTRKVCPVVFLRKLEEAVDPAAALRRVLPNRNRCFTSQ